MNIVICSIDIYRVLHLLFEKKLLLFILIIGHLLLQIFVHHFNICLLSHKVMMSDMIVLLWSIVNISWLLYLLLLKLLLQFAHLHLLV